MPEPVARMTIVEIVMELEAIAASMHDVSHPLRAEDVNDLCSAVARLAQFMENLFTETDDLHYKLHLLGQQQRENSP